MLGNDVKKKIESCKALQGETVSGVISSERFLSNLASYLQAQKEDRNAVRKSYEAMKRMGGAKGYKLPAHPVDRVVSMSADQVAVEFAKILSKKSTRPHSEREYIYQLGKQAYNLTIAQIVCDEFPELEPVLIPKNKAN